MVTTCPSLYMLKPHVPQYNQLYRFVLESLVSHFGLQLVAVLLTSLRYLFYQKVMRQKDDALEDAHKAKEALAQQIDKTVLLEAILQ
ncbi:hypothetical protein DXG03_002285 [Asterophora parasitica]|uniref:Uncharacterized protein n=1 Tax=Asterophora parasitica TaxID=117018 RepID=A0A9P7G309_9AGAR|nr:hypothetical protein DXG03_002285 [Asterophora parasitica]